MVPSPLSLNYDTSAIAQGLVEPDKDAFVFYINGGKTKLNMILSRIAPSRRIEGRVGNIQKPLMGYSSVQAQVATSTFVPAPGGSLVITFTDPTYANFRLNDIVMNNPSSNIQAIVTATAPGTITINGLGSNVIVNNSNFPVGSMISTNWNAMGYSADSRTSLYETPFYVQNWTSKFRDTIVLNEDDFYKTYAKPGGKFAYAFGQEMLLMDRCMRALEVRAVWSNASGVDVNWLGGRSTNMGLVASIQDPQRGGVVQGYPSPITEDLLIQTVLQVKQRYNEPVIRLLFLCGSQFLAQFQAITKTYITYTGINNTFGGKEVKGLDVMYYAIAGVHCGFVNIPAFDDPNIVPNMTTIPGLSGTMASNSAIIFDEGMYEEPQGNGMRPACEKIYCGSQEYIYKYRPGVVSGELAASSPLGGSIAVSGQDSFGVEFQTDSGIDCIAYRMAYIYPLN